MKKAVFKIVHLLILLLVCNVYVFAQCDADVLIDDYVIIQGATYNRRPLQNKFI